VTLPKTRRDPPKSVSESPNYGETFTEDELLCEEDELLPPEPDEVEEERRPFSYVKLRMPPLVRCTERVFLPAERTTSRLPPALVADMLDALEAEEGGFEADELSEEGNPT
jgi:hypothetical protein